MKRSLFAIRDSAVGGFHAPFMAPSNGVAIRSFRDEVLRKDAGNMMNQHPEDFELYLIGSYEEDTGVLESITPELLMRGKDAVALAN